MNGYFHGVPTMAGTLALSGNIFGLKGMNYISIFYYLSAIWLMYELTRRWNWKLVLSIGSALIFSISPIILWVTKSTLTESLLTLSLVLFIYFAEVTKDGKEGAKYFLLIPVSMFCFFHVSAFMLMPAFTGSIVLLFLTDRNKTYIRIHLLALAVFAAGFYMMLYTAPQYSYMNLASLYFGPINDDTLWLVPILYAVFAIVVVEFVRRQEQMNISFFVESRIFRVMVSICVLLALCFVCYTVHKYHLVQADSAKAKLLISAEWLGMSHFQILQYMPLFAICLCSGVFVVPLFIGTLVVSSKFYFSKHYIVVSFLFIYLALLCNVFVRQNVWYYYYYARYLSYVIPIAIIAGGIALTRISPWISRVLLILSILVLLPFSIFLSSHDDDSAMQTSELIDLCDALDKKSAVILDCSNSFISQAGLAIRELSHVHIFPLFENSDEEVKQLCEKYDQVYVISDQLTILDGEIVYRNKFTTNEYEQWSKNRWIPLINKSNENKTTITVLSIKEKGGLNCIDRMSSQGAVEKSDKAIDIGSGGTIYGPYIALSKGHYKLEVDVDGIGENEQSIRITSDVGQKDIYETLLHDGENIIEFDIGKRTE